MSAVVTTVYLTAIAMTCGVVLGTVLELMRQSQSRLLGISASFYIWLFRGTPLLVQIIFWFNMALFLPKVSLSIPGGPELFSVSTNSLVTPLVAAILALVVTIAQDLTVPPSFFHSSHTPAKAKGASSFS